MSSRDQRRPKPEDGLGDYDRSEWMAKALRVQEEKMKVRNRRACKKESDRGHLGWSWDECARQTIRLLAPLIEESIEDVDGYEKQRESHEKKVDGVAGMARQSNALETASENSTDVGNKSGD
jgi:hypothetical protein